MTRDIRSRLLALRESTGLSVGKIVQQSLGAIEKDFESVRKQGEQHGFQAGRRSGLAEGREAGFAEAMTVYRFAYPCDVCGELITVQAGDEEAKVAAKALAAGRWGHNKCHER